MSLLKLSFYKEHPDAKIPIAKDNGDVGLDVSSVEEVLIPPGHTRLIRTGLRLGNIYLSNLDTGLSVLLKIEGRSGMASKGIFPVGGIIDSLAYTGEIKVALVNSTTESYSVHKGDRICQIVAYPVFSNTYEVAEECIAVRNSASIIIEEIDTVRNNTDRKDAGFGSSGR